MTCLGYEFALNASRFQPRQLDSIGEAYVQRQTFFGGFSDDDDGDVDDDNDIMKDGGNKYGTLILIQIKNFQTFYTKYVIQRFKDYDNWVHKFRAVFSRPSWKPGHSIRFKDMKEDVRLFCLILLFVALLPRWPSGLTFGL